MKKIQYTDYLKSEHWQRRRKAYINSRPKNCIICGSHNNLHVHHKTYKNIGYEKDEDLTLLCDLCHMELHGHVKHGRVKLKNAIKYMKKRRKGNRQPNVSSSEKILEKIECNRDANRSNPFKDLTKGGLRSDRCK